MPQPIAIFWPGDYRAVPNTQAEPQMLAATAQLARALDKLGRRHYRVEGFLTKPNEAISKLGPIDDPLIGVYAHWVYGPHTSDGVVGRDTPLLMASNFSGQWPGLVGLLNTSACLESVGRAHSRVWTDAADWTTDKQFMDRLAEWCERGAIMWPRDAIKPATTVTGAAKAMADTVHDAIKRRRVLALMLGDTSMGMINGYFGPRLLNPIGFTEHKVDQAWIIQRGATISDARLDAALAFVKAKGVTFHYGADFDEAATREQLRDYLVVLDLVHEFEADCIGWQYQLGLIGLRPPSDFAEGLFNSSCRPESNGDVIIDSTEGDQGNLVPMELMKRLLKAKGLHQAVFFHDVRWGAKVDGRFLWLLLNSGSSGAYAFNHDPDTLKGVHSYRQPRGYFPVPGGTFAGESLPGAVTWARAWIRADGKLVMDLGKGEVVKLDPKLRDAWWTGTTREWPFMAIDMGLDRDALMAHYMSNHAAVCYGDIHDEMVALSHALGFEVRLLGH